MTAKQLSLWAQNGGIGDHLCLRPAVRFAAATNEDVILRTPWPQLFHDTRVKFEKPACSMRMESRNVAGMGLSDWTTPSPSAVRVHMGYDLESLSGLETPLRAALRSVGVPDWKEAEVDFSLPLREDWVATAKSRLASIGLAPGGYSVVHPPKIREDWRNVSRNPKHEYVEKAIRALPGPWISIGALEEGKERLAGPPLPVDYRFDRAELAIEELIALVAMAQMTVAGHSFIMPLAAALLAPALIIWGGYHPPEYYLDPDMEHESLIVARPNYPCACLDPEHECNLDVDLEPALRKAEAVVRTGRTVNPLVRQSAVGWRSPRRYFHL